MKYVFVILSSGIIDHVIFFDDGPMAVNALSEFVKTMNLEKQDAAVYGAEGIIANAKSFLDDNEQYVDNRHIILEKLDKKEKPVYIIGNPNHFLGFMVTSFDDPLGYKNPVEAVSDLGQMRQEHGIHLKLYQAIPAVDLVISKVHLEQYNKDCEVEDFDCSLIEEHLQ
jgi:hypothetical protein